MATLNDMPPEIIDRFLEDLAELFDIHKPGQKQAKDQSLRSCNQASRALHIRVRRLLFRDITLSVKPGKVTSRCSKNLHELMDPTNDRHLATYIKSFNIEIAIHGGGDTMRLLCDHHLPEILRWCSSIKTLSLEVLYGRCGWNQISEEIKAAFISLRLNYRLDTLRLSGFGLEVPVDVILHWTRMKRLILRAAPIAHILPPSALLPSIKLDALDLITNFSTSLEFLISNNLLPLGTLKHLNTTIYGRSDWIASWKLFHEVQATLQTLNMVNLFTTTHRWEIAAELMLTRTPKFGFTDLRSISILETHADKMHSIVELVVLMSSSPKLESIRIDLRWETLDEYRVGRLSSELEAVRWDELDRTLALKPCLKNLEFILRFAYPTSRMIHDWGRKLEGVRADWNPESIFPLLAEKEFVQKQLVWENKISDA